jgi:hypothetical protein
MARTQLVSPASPSIQWSVPGAGNSSVLSNYAFRLMTNIISAINGVVTPSGVSQNTLGNGVTISSGSGSPEGAVAGNIGDLFLSTSGGASTTLFVKQTGAPGSTEGWQGK